MSVRDGVNIWRQRERDMQATDRNKRSIQKQARDNEKDMWVGEDPEPYKSDYALSTDDPNAGLSDKDVDRIANAVMRRMTEQQIELVAQQAEEAERRARGYGFDPNDYL